MKDRSGERGAGESVKVNDPRAARSWPRRGQRLMGRYIPAAERGWIDVGITGAEQSGAERSGAGRCVGIIWHIERYARATRGRRAARFASIKQPSKARGPNVPAWARTTTGPLVLP